MRSSLPVPSPEQPPAQIVAQAAATGTPSYTLIRELVEAGGLMSYGPNADAFRRRPRSTSTNSRGREARRSAGRAADQFELVINLKTAKALGLDVPPTLLARADEVIE